MSEVGSQIIIEDSYLIQCGKYIELNPVRANLVKKPEDYQWSSYRHYAYGELDNLLKNDIFYSSLGDNIEKRQKNYQKMHIEEVFSSKIR